MDDLSPSLRFPEFSGSLESVTLGELTKINQGLQIPISNRYTEQKDGTYFYITNEFLRPGNKKKFFIKDPSSSVICQEDDVLMTRTGNTGQVVTGVSGAFHNNFFKINFDKEKLSRWFLIHFLRHHKTQHTILKFAGTSTIPDLNHSDFYRIGIQIPSFDEQLKIADFLTVVDKKISLLKEKHALLKQYKKGVMQKLFKQEIRFKDGNGSDFPDWKVVKVANLMEESRIKGSTGDKARKMTVKLWGKGVYEKDDKQGGSANTQYYRRKAGQFIYSKLDFLNCAFGVVPKELDGLETTADLPCFDIAAGTNSYFILEYIKQKRFYKKYGDMADGSRKAKRIHADTFLSFPFNLPSKEEQDKIADFLQTIDEKIGLVKKQIELTQTFKKGLLQQMFV